MLILTDRDLESPPVARMRAAIARHIAADAKGEAVAPPRHIVEFGEKGLVFTIGGSGELAGFRAYQTFAKAGNPRDGQVVAAWSRETGDLLAVAIGNRLGALRTGCIGGVAVDTLAPSSAKIAALIGSGRQAETQLIGLAGLRPLAEIRIWARRREAAEAMVARLGDLMPASAVFPASAEEAVRGADIVILATTATAPVIEAGWVGPHAHVTTLGPNARSAHELPPEIARRAKIIVSDSPQQLAALGGAFMLAGTPEGARLGHLGALIGGFDPDRERGLTLFFSIGLAGTEVAALAAIAETRT